MIPFGQFRPDAAQINAPVCTEAKNVVPGVSTFKPLPSPVASTTALDSTCRGAVSVVKDDGSVVTYAGTQTKLYQLNTSAGWDDVTRVSGGDYSVGAGEQWKWDIYGNNLIGANVNDNLQFIDVVSGTNFAAVSGAPKARYIAVLREFVLVGAIFGNEKRVQWSSNGNMTGWTAGVSESDYQDLPNGGPVRGLIGGEVGYVFQANRVSRMTYQAGSPVVFSFDEVEGGVGLAGPHSLVKLRNEAFYLATDGFRKFALGSVQSQPIGTAKWTQWFLNDIKAGSELTVVGAANPVKPQIVWAYQSRSATGSNPNRMMIYDWSLDEATYAELTVESLVKWLSPGLTLDTMSAAGYTSLDGLPFSLDSAFWKGGASVLGVFGTDHKLSLLSGTPMEAQIVTGDGQQRGRMFVTGTMPKVDAAGVQVEVSMRERMADTPTYGTSEVMEDTGVVPAHVSGNIARARITIPSQNWTQIEGIDAVAEPAGSR